MEDEIINELRATKEALAEQYNFDIRRIYQDIKCSEIQTETEGWEHIQPTVVLPESSLQRVRFVHR